jgi:hypothetical protein
MHFSDTDKRIQIKTPITVFPDHDVSEARETTAENCNIHTRRYKSFHTAYVTNKIKTLTSSPQITIYKSQLWNTFSIDSTAQPDVQTAKINRHERHVIKMWVHMFRVRLKYNGTTMRTLDFFKIAW